MISLIYSVSGSTHDSGTGLGEYSRRLVKGLESNGQNIEKIEVVKKEYSVGGKPLLGNLSLVLGTRIKKPQGEIVHSLSPEVIHPKTNVVTVHDVIPLKLKDVYSQTYYRKKGTDIVFKKIRDIEQIIAFTKQGMKEIHELGGVELDRINIVPQSIDHDLFYPDPDKNLENDDTKLIVTVGDLNPRKRFDILFDALGGQEGYKLVHIGPTNSWEERRSELASKARKFGNVEMLGKVDSGTLRRYMSSADLLVHLSEGEGFGYTPLEAMACGTNVLVNDLEVFRETLDDRAFFTTLEVHGVRRDIDYALSHPMSPESLSNHARQYSVDRMAKNTLEVYKKITTDF